MRQGFLSFISLIDVEQEEFIILVSSILVNDALVKEFFYIRC